MRNRAQSEAAARRYRATAEGRAAIDRRMRRDDVRVVDSPDQLEARIARLTRVGWVGPETLREAVPRVRHTDRMLLLQHVIDRTGESQAANFLARGARAARTVGRLAAEGSGTPRGTAFLVAPSLVLTNHHVLRDREAARRTVLEFNHERDVDNRAGEPAVYALDPGALFLTDEALDYTLVAVHSGPDGSAPGEAFGWNRLIRAQGKVVIGEPVNVIGHPAGRRKEIAIRDNTLRYQLHDFLQYGAGTEPGSSGSPVFNDQWEVVGLHHAAIPDTDERGRWLTVDGRPIDPDHDPDDAGVRWIANEGLRTSAFLTHVRERRLDEAQRALLATMGEQAVAERPPAAPVGVRGVRATGPTSGTQLVFLPGPGPHEADPAPVRAAWAAALRLDGVTAGDLWLPCYGDVLTRASAVPEAVPVGPEGSVLLRVGDAPRTVEAPDSPSTRELYAALLDAAAGGAAGPEEEPLVSRIRRALDRLAGAGAVDGYTVATHFRDLALYLDRAAVREAVLDAVTQCLPMRGRVVIVAHGLGTVVAADLVTRLPRGLTVDTLVTLGSPLGLDGVARRTPHARPDPSAPISHPVPNWINAWSPADVIGRPLADDWKGVVDVETDNARERAHDITRYLSDRRVAGAVYNALRGTP
ncbi:hypothetical protein Val02_37550 [Virgisporangium aliadipatigenens]|uniref:Serine protease n=1 Tax=Virgisporangium aliadipatigenens TaxID=741659 RepID=A0A8J4DQR2_9ACTN|nr:serine protease [Virgisporangium aliadipatigenens]GIJ46869.1 hypothetical protein Val02_37550 [Virgisporangium aliadipatigenens]